MIDLRSDTVTKPTDAMRAAMAAAEVGDDVYGEDPTVNELEARTAALLGKEAAVFVPTGTMSNQIAVRIQTEPGDAALVEGTCHVVVNEGGGAAAISGVSIVPLRGTRGVFSAADVDAAVGVSHKFKPATLSPPARLLCVENTHNAGGGTVWTLEAVRSVCEAGRRHGLALHLDGARLWHATAASGVPERDFAAPFDTVNVCYSKGLGAPIGSALAGSKELVARARRFKQQLGGGLRQAGMLAAAALHALDHHRPHLQRRRAPGEGIRRGHRRVGRRRRGPGGRALEHRAVQRHRWKRGGLRGALPRRRGAHDPGRDARHSRGGAPGHRRRRPRARARHHRVGGREARALRRGRGAQRQGWTGAVPVGAERGPVSGQELATLGGGCFWCLEAVFESVQGVSSAKSGYAGGNAENPTYQQVCNGRTGHAEVVQVAFDPAVISYRDLLEIFFAIHDPTTLNRQGADVGTQYRSAIFTHSDAQRDVARGLVAELNEGGTWDAPIVTEITPLERFYPAEGYHDQYFRLHGEQPYCRIVIGPKLAKFRKGFAHRLSAGP